MFNGNTTLISHAAIVEGAHAEQAAVARLEKGSAAEPDIPRIRSIGKRVNETSDTHGIWSVQKRANETTGKGGIWPVEKRADETPDTHGIWSVEKRANETSDTGGIWSVQKRAPAAAEAKKFKRTDYPAPQPEGSDA